MGISFIDHHHRAFGLVGDQPFDIRLGRQGAGRVVGIADVDQTRIGHSRHRLNVMRIVFGQRYTHNLGADKPRRALTRFIAGIGS